MSFLKKMQARWNLGSLWQVILVLLVFACTGFTVLFLKKPIFWLIGFDKMSGTLLGTVLYLVLVLPLYQVVLLFYGIIFGQFRFFWEFEKKMFRRIVLLFSRK